MRLHWSVTKRNINYIYFDNLKISRKARHVFDCSKIIVERFNIPIKVNRFYFYDRKNTNNIYKIIR